MIFHFDGYSLDTVTYVLSKGGEAIPVEPKAFRLLQFLVENRERVVVKNEIIEQVWDGRIVSDAVLTTGINAVRRAVGDNGKTQRIIKTFPGKGYRLIAEVEVENWFSRNSVTQTPFDKPAIAVLPFTNLSGDAEQEFFADGLTEDIITALSYWKSFSVISRNSTFQYKGASPDIREVATHLNVGYVLEGSVRQSGDRIRISAQLVQGTTGNHIWAEKYDRTIEDFFELQDEITQVIAAKLEPELAKAEWRRTANKQTADMNAWECYHRALSALDEYTEESNLKAQELFKRAIELDPSHGRAYSGLAYAIFRYSHDGYSRDRGYDLENIRRLAKQANTFDDRDATGYLMQAVAVSFSGELEHGIALAHRAIGLNPNQTQAYLPLGNALNLLGRSEEAIGRFEMALRLNPNDVRAHIFLSYLADAYLNNRDYENTVTFAQMAIERQPGHGRSHGTLAAALGHLGRTSEARAALSTCLELHPGFVENHPYLNLYRNSEDREHLLDGFKKAGWSGG